MNIKILGSGCANCNKLEALAKEVVAELGTQAEFDHVRDFKAIAAYGMMTTPGLVVEGKVRSAGRIPSKAEITSWITTAMSAE